MLSDFIKKLIFAREFEMIDGRIKVLNQYQTMISLYTFLKLIALDKKSETNILKECVAKDIGLYERRLGVKKNSYEHIPELFELFGVGNLVVVDLNMKEKKALVEIHKSPLPAIAFEEKISKEEAELVFNALLEAVFSYVFDKEVKSELVEYYIDRPCKFIVK